MKCCHTLCVVALLPAGCLSGWSELPLHLNFPPNSFCGTGSIKSAKCERLSTRKDVSRRWDNIVSWSLVLSITRYISWELNGGWRRFMRSGMSPSPWGSQPRWASCHLQCTVIVQISVCVCVSRLSSYWTDFTERRERVGGSEKSMKKKAGLNPSIIFNPHLPAPNGSVVSVCVCVCVCVCLL